MLIEVPRHQNRAPLIFYSPFPNEASLGGRLIGKVVDAEAQVEKALIQELETAFKEFGIEARIFSVDGPQMVGRSHLEIPVQVRDVRDVNLSD